MTPPRPVVSTRGGLSVSVECNRWELAQGDGAGEGKVMGPSPAVSKARAVQLLLVVCTFGRHPGLFWHKLLPLLLHRR